MQTSLSDSERFREALKAGDLEELRRVPKTGLHVHSIFGTRIENIESWIHRPLPRPPLRMASLDDMREYAHRVLYPHILNRAGFEFTAESAIRDAVEDGVVRIEMSLDVRFMRLYETARNGFLDFVARLPRISAERIDVRPEIGVSRNRPPETEIPLAMVCVRSGLFRSLDLYGNETAEPPEAYRALYAEAHGLKKKVHVGEFGDVDLVDRTLEVLRPDEIQHGIAAAASSTTMDRIRSGGMRLNVCPTSNVCLGAVESIGRHPIRTLVDRGIRVSINTDDLTIFGRSASQEYLELYRSGLLAAEELDGIRRDSLDS
jgi:adenosine deaminase